MLPLLHAHHPNCRSEAHFATSFLTGLQVSSAVDNATARIEQLLRSMDSVVLTLDHSNVAGVYQQGKSFFCCSLVQQAYTQWAATITLVALAWVAMQFALLVLGKLDSLSGGCVVERRVERGGSGRWSESWH